MKKKRILITTGDVDGVGPEVTYKALAQIHKDEDFQYIVFRSKFDDKFCLSKISNGHSYVEVKSLQEAINKNEDIVVVTSEHPPAKWVEIAAESCLNEVCDALVTGPLSKTEIVNSGYNQIGHTEILKKVSGAKAVYMTFLGSKFNVLLLTGHIPVKMIPSYINKVNLEESIKTAQVVVNLLCTEQKNRPIGFIGLNPHAGEHGLIGSEEMQIIKPTIEHMKYNGVNIEGPLVPDAAFLPNTWDKYSIFISPYHDQGLTA
ncbi:MAG: 4-hydroxythreonine-4-phosphate dehydrogenase PdxA, partial [Bdellovibrionales bacterium]|nr:4-hydroxythreonine-4-phosphate dehydrogenase PdxA [Bdellovibrionales bacterium]